MSDLLDHYAYDDQVSRLQAEVARLQGEVDRLTLQDEELREVNAELEFDNEGLSKLVAAYKRVVVMEDLGFVLVRSEPETDECGCTVTRDEWVKGTLREPAGSFDRDAADAIHKAYEEATR
jgi:branched-subunit amino acid aminotransferase/4-amino-4-deoxychorismate lyase